MLPQKLEAEEVEEEDEVPEEVEAEGVVRVAVEGPSRRWRGRGRLRAPFYPASRPRRNCGTARLLKKSFL